MKKIMAIFAILLLAVPLVLAFSNGTPDSVMKKALKNYDKHESKGRLMRELKSSSEVSDVTEFGEDITVYFKDGRTSVIIGSTFFGRPNTPPGLLKKEDPVDPPEPTPVEFYPGDLTAIILDPFEWEGSVFSNPALIASITADLESEGYTVEYYANSVDPEDNLFGLNEMKTIMNKGVVYNRGHGGVAGDGNVVVLTNECYDDSTPGSYPDDYADGLIYQCWIRDLQGYIHGKICYTPAFVTTYYSEDNTMPNSLVYMETCSGLANPTMADAWTSVGAGSYLGWSGTVSVTGGDTAAQQNFQDLTVGDMSVVDTVTSTPTDGRGRNKVVLGFEGLSDLGL